VEKNAALMVADANAPQTLIDTILELLGNQHQGESLSLNLAQLAMLDADETIAKEVLKLAGWIG